MAYLPAVLAAAGTVGLLSLLGESLNMLSLVALLMVVSMGVDYGVFLAENRHDARQLDATHLAQIAEAIRRHDNPTLLEDRRPRNKDVLPSALPQMSQPLMG